MCQLTLPNANLVLTFPKLMFLCVCVCVCVCAWLHCSLHFSLCRSLLVICLVLLMTVLENMYCDMHLSNTIISYHFLLGLMFSLTMVIVVKLVLVISSVW